MTRHRRSMLALMLSTALLLGTFQFPGSVQGAIAPVVSALTGIAEGTSTPVRLAADQLGNIYVADQRAGGILKFSASGKLLKTFATAKDVLGIALAQNGDLLASQGSAVAVLDSSNGAQLSQFGSFGKANGIAVDGNGFVYVTDSISNCVQVFNSAYAPVATGAAAAGLPNNSFGSKGLATGQFLLPTGISYEKVSRQLAVADSLNGRVQFFSTSGVYQSSLGSFGSGPLKFSSPQGIAFEYSKDGSALSRIYVVDSFQSNIQVIDAASSAFLSTIGSYGASPGKLVVPADLLYDQFNALNNRLIVANGTGSLALYSIDPAAAPNGSGPRLTINSVPLATDLSVLTISGTTDPGALVTANGAAATVIGTTWTSTIFLTPGTNVITVAAANPAGTTVQSVSVEATVFGGGLPQVALSLTPIPAATGSSSVTLSGTVTSGAGVSVNGVPAQVAGSAWSLAVSLTPGNNVFLVTASKPGFASGSESLNITLDSSVPVLSALLLQNGATTGTPVQTVSGTVADSAASSVVIGVNGTSRTVPVLNGLFSTSVPLAFGANSLTLTALDAAGNASAPVVRTINYDPQAPAATVATPNGAVSATAGFTLSGTAPAGCLVTVNSLPASSSTLPKTAGSLTGGSSVAWSYSVTLAPGVNYFEVKVSDPVSGKTSSTAQTVTYAQGAPALTVTAPALDIATARPSLPVTGTVTPGATVSASINGANIPVALAGDGSFALTLPAFAAPGNYAVVLRATDSSGNSSSVTRSVIYDPSVPQLSVLSEDPPKVSASGGVLVSRDKNGPVGSVTISGASSSLDLTGVSYDPASLNIYAVAPGGASTRNGNLSGDGQLAIKDALRALLIGSGIVAPTLADRLHGDVFPLVSGVATPDGAIDSRDALIILRASIGLINLY